MLKLKGHITGFIKRIENLISSFQANKFEKTLVKDSIKYSFLRTNEHILWDNVHILNKLIRNNKDGSIVECGVEAGHSLVFFQKIVEHYNLNNCKIYGFDTFEGTPEPKDFDINAENKPMKIEYQRKLNPDGTSGWNNSSFEEVKKNFSENTKMINNLVLVKGRVEQTLQNKDNIPEKILILKLDANLYEATKIELEKLFPKIQKGGVLIVDNYGIYKGIKKAVDEYFISQNYKIKYSFLTKRVIVYV